MKAEDVLLTLKSYFEPLGLEVHIFQTGWYNDTVSPVFRLNYPSNTIAFVIISTPSMFETAFIPFLQQKVKTRKNSEEENVKNSAVERSDLKSSVHDKNGVDGNNVKENETNAPLNISSWCDKDPLDSCLSYHFQRAVSLFSDTAIEVIHDYELLPNRRPKILVQTAAHVASAAYYYQKSDVEKLHEEHCQVKQENEASPETSDADDGSGRSPMNKASINSKRLACTCVKPWADSKRIYGVCIHPQYGGWFAIRGVFIFPNLKENIERQPPVDCVSTRTLRIELLNRFNGNWQDWSYRDIIPVSEKYSDLQKRYFATLPKNRHFLLDELVASS